MKRFFQRYLPDHQKLRTHKNLRFLGDLLARPSPVAFWSSLYRARIWRLGAFCAFVPIPWQMLLAAVTAAWLRFNLPVAVAMVWITNPLTLPPIAFVNYHFGAWLLGRPPEPWAFEPSLDWLLQKAGEMGLPLLVGSMATAVVAGTLTFCIAHLLWRWHIIAKFRRRRRVVACSH